MASSLSRIGAALLAACAAAGCSKMNAMNGAGGGGGGTGGVPATGGGATDDGGVGGTGGTTGTGAGTDGGVVGTTTKYVFHVFDGPGDHAGGTTVNGISNKGAIVGFSANKGATNLTNFIRNADGTFTELMLKSPTAMANGINSTDQVVGAKGATAFLYTAPMTLTTLANAAANLTSQIAFGINDAGAIVGQFTDGNGSPGYLLVKDKFTDISPPTAMVTNAQGVNANGLVIGFFATAAAVAGPVINGNVAQHGFLFDSAKGTYSNLPDPNVPKLFLTQYLGINGKGQAVGYWQDMAGSQHGFIYDLAAGSFNLIDAPDAKPVSGVSVTQVVGIDDAAEIAGFFIDAAGLQHGFYATPQ